MTEMAASDAALQRTEELLERMRVHVDALEASAHGGGGDLEQEIERIQEINEHAKQIEAEVQRARQAADAGA